MNEEIKHPWAYKFGGFLGRIIMPAIDLAVLAGMVLPVFLIFFFLVKVIKWMWYF